MPLKVHVFPYSSRKQTKAAGFKDSVDPKIIKERCIRLEANARKIRIKLMRKFINKKLPVLIEGKAKDFPDFLEGLTDNYLQVKLPFKPNLNNQIVNARIKGVLSDKLIGEYIDNS
jgi:threonylcarbamoyladenosine tRNA methylthiotransferase MtaB